MASAIAKLTKDRQETLSLSEEGTKEDRSSDVLFGLPAMDIDEFLGFEKKLLDPDFRKEVVKALKQVGGANIGAVARGVMHRVMDDSVAVLYSYSGGKGKKRFDELKFKDVVFGTVRAHAKHSNATDAEIRTIIATWLANAKTHATIAKNKSAKKSLQTDGGNGDESSGDELLSSA